MLRELDFVLSKNFVRMFLKVPGAEWTNTSSGLPTHVKEVAIWLHTVDIPFSVTHHCVKVVAPNLHLFGAAQMFLISKNEMFSLIESHIEHSMFLNLALLTPVETSMAPSLLSI